MAGVNASIIIKKPVAEVFAFVSDFRNDNDWWLGVLETKVISEAQLGLGTRYWQLSRFMGLRNETVFEIVEYNPITHVTLRSIEAMIPFVACFTFEPVPEGTRFTMNAEVEWRGFYKLLAPLFTFFMRRGTNNFFKKLKEVLEKPA